MSKRKRYPCHILYVIGSGLFVAVEEGDPERPNTYRTYVESAYEIVNNPRYAKAWKEFTNQ